MTGGLEAKIQEGGKQNFPYIDTIFFVRTKRFHRSLLSRVST